MADVNTSTPSFSPSFAPTLRFPTTQEPIGSQDLKVSFGLYTFLGCVCLLAYSLLRRSKFFYYNVYYPLFPHDAEEVSSYAKVNRKSKIKPPSRQSLFSWFLPLLNSEREKEVLRTCGLDAYVTLRVTRIPLYAFGIWTIFSVFFIIPLFTSARSNENTLEGISISNLNSEDVELLRWTFVCMLFLIITVLFLVKREYEHFITVRKQYMAKRCTETFSVIVERIPKKLLSREVLTKYFESLIGNVLSVEIVPGDKLTTPLQSLITRRNQVLLSMELAQQYNEKHSKRKSIFTFDMDPNQQKIKDYNLDTELSEKTQALQIVEEKDEVEKDLEADIKPAPILLSDDEKVTLLNGKFRDLDSMVKEEVGGNISTQTWLMSLLQPLGCCNSRFLADSKMQEVDAEVFYQQKLETINRMIYWLQAKAQILVDSAPPGLNRSQKERYTSLFQPSEDETGPLLDSVSVFETPVNKSYSKLDVAEKEKETPTKKNKILKMGLQIKEDLVKLFDKEEREEQKEDLLKYLEPSAIITFSTKSAANIVASLEVNEVRDSMITSIAKNPKDLFWYNLSYSTVYKTMVGFVIFFLLGLFLIFFGTIISGIALITNLDNLRGSSGFLDDLLNDFEFLVPLFEQLAPLLLVAVFVLVPPIMIAILNIQKPISQTEGHASFMTVYYIFGVIQLFIFYQISGSLATILGETLTNPAEIIDILADTVPNNAIFFMQFILIKAVFVLPSELLRLTDLIMSVFLRRLCGCKSISKETAREREAAKCGCFGSAQYPVYPLLAQINAQSMLIYTIGICYSVIAPLIAPITLVYVLIFNLVYRNQFLYVYAQQLKEMDSLGTQFESMMSTFHVSLILLTLTMIGLFGIFERVALVTLSFFLLIGLILVKIYFQKAYNGETNGLPLSLAKLYDLKERINFAEEMENELIDFKPKVKDYRHPTLKENAFERL